MKFGMKLWGNYDSNNEMYFTVCFKSFLALGPMALAPLAVFIKDVKYGSAKTNILLWLGIVAFLGLFIYSAATVPSKNVNAHIAPYYVCLFGGLPTAIICIVFHYKSADNELLHLLFIFIVAALCVLFTCLYCKSSWWLFGAIAVTVIGVFGSIPYDVVIVIN